jgi:toxin FitB
VESSTLKVLETNVTESKSKAIVFDSSCWIEILNNGPLSKVCEKELKSASRVLVPTLVFYEVYRKVSSTVSEDQGLSVVALLSQYETSELTRDISLAAADISIAHKLPMADSIILAHATQENATLVTLDNDFAGLSHSRVIR